VATEKGCGHLTFGDLVIEDHFRAQINIADII
jgi:hypothetical protein